MGKIKIGSRVKTTKGDRYNPNAKKELLEVIELTNGWNGLESAICRKENGKIGRFLIKNLVII